MGRSLNLKDYTREFPRNLQLAYPVMLGMIGHTLVAFVDNVMVGQLGTAELAAVSLANSFVFIGMSIGIGFSTAITPLVAEADGGGKPRVVSRAFSHGLLLCTVMGIVLFAAVYMAKPLLGRMGQPEEVVELAGPFLDIIAFSLIPLVIYQAFKQFTEGMSQTRIPMYATIVANLVNVALNYALIFGNWGFPRMGVVGAAYGTLVARILLVLLMIAFIQFHNRLRHHLQAINWRRTHFSYLQRIISLGFPSALQVFFEVALFTSAVWISGLIGKNAQAANHIALNLASMTFMVAIGLSVTAMIRVGNQKGVGNYPELRRIANSIFLLTLLIQATFAAVFWLGADVLPTIYLNMDDASQLEDYREVLSRASRLLIFAAIFQLSDGIQVVTLGALRGLQDVKVPALITFVAYWLVGFPVCYYAGLKTPLEGQGIWLGLLAGLTASALMLYLRFRNLLSKRLAR